MLVVVGLLFVYKHYRRELATIRLRDARLLRKLPVTAIAEAQSGLVKFVGVAKSDQGVMSYFDRVPCVAHRMVTTTYEGSRRVGTVIEHRYRISREWQLVPFVLDDGSGSIAIDPRGAAIDYEVCHPDENGTVQEHRIRAGDRIAVVGHIDVAQSGGYRTATRTDAVKFVSPPMLSWRTDDEFLPVLRPPPVPVALASIGPAGNPAADVTGNTLQMVICAGGSLFVGLFFFARFARAAAQV
jgi:hypothetical protein